MTVARFYEAYVERGHAATSLNGRAVLAGTVASPLRWIARYDGHFVMCTADGDRAIRRVKPTAPVPKSWRQIPAWARPARVSGPVTILPFDEETES